MACKRAQNFLFRSNHYLGSWRNNGMRTRLLNCHSGGEESPEGEEEIMPSEWWELALSKMKKWSHKLKELDLVCGRVVNISDQSRVLDDKLEHRMQTFKSMARVFIVLPSMKETVRKNLMASFPNTKLPEFQHFSRRHERDALIVNSLTKISDILGISAQQRKVTRHTICPQVTRHHIWTEALVEILKELNNEISVLINHRPTKDTRLAQQIVVGCLKLLESSISYDPETSSWMRLTPTKGVDSSSSKWEDVLEMFTDLVNCLRDENQLSYHVSKLEAMKEGLYQVRDVLIDKNIGYKESRHQENLVQKKLSKNLGHSSRCLFRLLLYYLYGSVGDIEVDVCGGFHVIGGGKFCLYMGKILTVDEEKVVRNGVKQLDRALGLFKFVWEAAGIKGDLQLHGHLWCVGAQSRAFEYRGNIYLVHRIDMR